MVSTYVRMALIWAALCRYIFQSLTLNPLETGLSHARVLHSTESCAVVSLYNYACPVRHRVHPITSLTHELLYQIARLPNGPITAVGRDWGQRHPHGPKSVSSSFVKVLMVSLSLTKAATAVPGSLATSPPLNP